jgi:hypothetical protein
VLSMGVGVMLAEFHQPDGTTDTASGEVVASDSDLESMPTLEPVVKSQPRPTRRHLTLSPRLIGVPDLTESNEMIQFEPSQAPVARKVDSLFGRDYGYSDYGKRKHGRNRIQVEDDN